MTTALVLIDLQNDYFPGGAMELVGADAAVSRVAALLEAFRRRSLPVFHIQHLASPPAPRSSFRARPAQTSTRRSRRPPASAW